MPETIITIPCIVDLNDRTRKPELCRLQVPFEHDGKVYENIGLLKRDDLSSAIFKIESHKMPDGCNIEIGIRVMEIMAANSTSLSTIPPLVNDTPIYKLCMMGKVKPYPGMVRMYMELQQVDIAGMMLSKYSRYAAEKKEAQRQAEEDERARREADRLRKEQERLDKIKCAEDKVAPGGPEHFTLTASETILLIDKYGVPCLAQTRKMIVNRDIDTCFKRNPDGGISIVSIQYVHRKGTPRLRSNTPHIVMNVLIEKMRESLAIKENAA